MNFSPGGFPRPTERHPLDRVQEDTGVPHHQCTRNLRPPPLQQVLQYRWVRHRVAHILALQPQAGQASLRFRVRGELRRERMLPLELAGILADQLEGLAAGNGTRAPIRTGTVRYEVSGLPISMDYRVVETPLGPSVALRLEEGGQVARVGLGQLGLSLEGLAAFEAMLAERQGVVLVAGPRHTGAYHAILERAVRLGGGVTSLERQIGRLVPGVTQLDLGLVEDQQALGRLLHPLPDWLGVDGTLDQDVLRLAG